jgi:hypothetical protein
MPVKSNYLRQDSFGFGFSPHCSCPSRKHTPRWPRRQRRDCQLHRKARLRRKSRARPAAWYTCLIGGWTLTAATALTTSINTGLWKLNCHEHITTRNPIGFHSRSSLPWQVRKQNHAENRDFVQRGLHSNRLHLQPGCYKISRIWPADPRQLVLDLFSQTCLETGVCNRAVAKYSQRFLCMLHFVGRPHLDDKLHTNPCVWLCRSRAFKPSQAANRHV